MKRAVVAIVLSCGGTAPPSVTLPTSPRAVATAQPSHPRPSPLPAGACGFDGTLDGCKGNASWAVITAIAHDETEATKALARARALPVVDGYPFAIHSDELPAADFREGIEIVVGLFEKEHDARDEANALHAEAIPLATWEAYREHLPDFDEHRAVVEMLEDARAFDEQAVDTLEHGLRGDLKDDTRLRASFASTHAGACVVHRGDVFVTIEGKVAERSYGWAPVRCSGREAFVLDRATRFKAVVTHERPPMIWQVVQVQCAPTVESRPLGPAPATLGETHMNDDCY